MKTKEKQTTITIPKLTNTPAIINFLSNKKHSKLHTFALLFRKSSTEHKYKIPPTKKRMHIYTCV